MAPIYDLLARLLTAEVDEALWAGLTSPGTAALLERAAPGFTGAATSRDALAAEFATLLADPDGVPPVAGAWLDARRTAALTTLVGRAMAALGVAQAGSGTLALDHAGLLCALVAAGLRGSEREQALATHLQREALDPWAGRFGAALSARAQSPLYRAVGALLVSLHSPESHRLQN